MCARAEFVHVCVCVRVCVRARVRACVCGTTCSVGGGARPPTFEERVCVAEQAQHVRNKRPVFVRVLRELIVHCSTVMHPEHPQEIFPAELAIGESTFIYEDLQAVCVFMPREVLQEEAVDSRALLNFRWDQQRAGHFVSEARVTRRKWRFPFKSELFNG